MNKDTLYKQLGVLAKDERLQERFRDKPYHEKYAWLRLSAFSLSLVISALSIAGALYGLKWAFRHVVPSEWLAMALAGSLLLIIEVGKHKSSDTFWDTFWKKNRYVSTNWLLLSLTLFGLSLVSSTMGIFQTLQDLAPTPVEVAQDSAQVAIQAEIAGLNKSTRRQEKTTWKGKIVTQANRNIAEFAKQKTALLGLYAKKEQKRMSQEEKEQEKQDADLALAILFCLSAYIILEVIFETCRMYISHIDWRELCHELEPQGLEYAAQFVGIGISEKQLLQVGRNSFQNRAQIGFKTPVSNSSGTPVSKQSESVAQQQQTPVSNSSGTTVSNSSGTDAQTGCKQVTVLKTPNVDISTLKTCANTYYKRSLTSKSEEARNRNREKYEEHRTLLSGVGIQCIENEDQQKVTFTTKK